VRPFTTRAELLETVRGLRADLEQAIAEAGPERIERAGTLGPWSFKDVIAHLTGWREVTAARLEAALRGTEPVFPWPAPLNEDDHLDAINQWFEERGRSQSLAETLAESRATFERVEHALAQLPEDDVFKPRRFAWLGDYALGPAVVEGTYEHYRVDHEPAIRAWLAQG
jgi:hypothetical protein